jgi:ubiquitin-protein ligase
MCDILQRIVSLIHQDVNPFSPANVDVFRMSTEEPVLYKAMLREQAQRYSKKS